MFLENNIIGNNGYDKFIKILGAPYSYLYVLQLTGNPGAKIEGFHDLFLEAAKVKTAWEVTKRVPVTKRVLKFEDWSSDLLTFKEFSEHDWDRKRFWIKAKISIQTQGYAFLGSDSYVVLASCSVDDGDVFQETPVRGFVPEVNPEFVGRLNRIKELRTELISQKMICSLRR